MAEYVDPFEINTVEPYERTTDRDEFWDELKKSKINDLYDHLSV